MAAAFPHKKDEKVFYVRKYGYSFPVKKLGLDGKPIQKTNPNTGMEIYLPNGDPEFIEKFYDFTKWKTTFCADGYVSVYVCTKDTDPRVIAALEAEAASRGSEVMDEKTFIRTVNPELADKLEEDEKLKGILSDKDGKINSLLAEVESLKQRLSGQKK